jgi:hypothetical protein
MYSNLVFRLNKTLNHLTARILKIIAHKICIAEITIRAGDSYIRLENDYEIYYRYLHFAAQYAQVCLAFKPSVSFISLI